MSEQGKAKPGSLERRSFLRGLGIAAGGAAAVPAVAVAADAEKGEWPEEQAKSRYRATEHVKRFYALNRL
jgi:hypothetical protein